MPTTERTLSLPNDVVARLDHLTDCLESRPEDVVSTAIRFLSSALGEPRPPLATGLDQAIKILGLESASGLRALWVHNQTFHIELRDGEVRSVEVAADCFIELWQRLHEMPSEVEIERHPHLTFNHLARYLDYAGSTFDGAPPDNVTPEEGVAGTSPGA